MTRSFIYSLLLRSLVPAEIQSGITREVLEQTQAKWKESKRIFLSRQLQERSLPKHHAWNWATKHREAVSGHHDFYAVVCDGRVEGLMMLRIKPRPSRMAGGGADKVLYIEYVEAAPWNLEMYAGREREFSAVGTVLINAAVTRSIEAGCAGRIGLHSLPDVEDFYRKHNFVDIGFDPVDGLRYFELRSVVQTPEGIGVKQ